MRLEVIFEVDGNKISSDYRRKFISFIKGTIKEADNTLFSKIYTNTNLKPYTFAVNLGKVNFIDDHILLTSSKIKLNLSINDRSLGLKFFNTVLDNVGNEFKLSEDVCMRLCKVIVLNEKFINDNKIIFKILSPIVVRDHNKNKNIDWYYCFKDKEFTKKLKRNLKGQLIKKSNLKLEEDIDDLVIENVSLKKTVVSNYGIKFPVTIGSFAITGEKYLLEKFYREGLGSKKSSGFGMLDIVG